MEALRCINREQITDQLSVVGLQLIALLKRVLVLVFLAL